MMRQVLLNDRQKFSEKSQEKIKQLTSVSNQLRAQLHTSHPESYADYQIRDLKHASDCDKLLASGLNDEKILSHPLLYKKWETDVTLHLNDFENFCIELYRVLSKTEQPIHPSHHALQNFIKEHLLEPDYALQEIEKKYQQLILQATNIQLGPYPDLYPQNIIDSINEEYRKLSRENITDLRAKSLIAQIDIANAQLQDNLNLINEDKILHDMKISTKRAKKIIDFITLFRQTEYQFDTLLTSSWSATSEKISKYFTIQDNVYTCSSKMRSLRKQDYNEKMYAEIASIEQMTDKLSISAAKYFLDFYKKTNLEFYKKASEFLEERNKTPMPATDEDIQKMTDHYQQLKTFLESCTDQTTLQDLQKGAKPLYCNFSIFCDTQEKTIKEQRESKNSMQFALNNALESQRAIVLEQITTLTKLLDEKKDDELFEKLYSRTDSNAMNEYSIELRNKINEALTRKVRIAEDKANGMISELDQNAPDNCVFEFLLNLTEAKESAIKTKSMKPLDDFLDKLQREIKHHSSKIKAKPKSAYEEIEEAREEKKPHTQEAATTKSRFIFWNPRPTQTTTTTTTRSAPSVNGNEPAKQMVPGKTAEW